jgi:hypothetical protein
VVRWLESATIPITDLVRPGTGAARTRALLDRISTTKDGTLAAANTANRKRAVLNNAMQYAVEMNVFPANPLKTVKWTRPRTLKTVDPRAVVNADQARRFLAAVGELGPRGERMVRSSAPCTTLRSAPKRQPTYGTPISPACPITDGER